MLGWKRTVSEHTDFPDLERLFLNIVLGVGGWGGGGGAVFKRQVLHITALQKLRDSE